MTELQQPCRLRGWLSAVGLVLVCANPAMADGVPSHGDADVRELRLQYAAQVAGVYAGDAEIVLGLDGNGYRVAGSARSAGVWERFQRWRARFSVQGLLAPGADPEMQRFYSLQTTPRKMREIVIADGVLNEIKNQKVRPPRAPLPGFDLLTAMFFVPDCRQAAAVHTGRHGYRLERQAGGGAQCTYRVSDEDDAWWRLTVRYRELDGFRVPARITVASSGLRGSLTLKTPDA